MKFMVRDKPDAKREALTQLAAQANLGLPKKLDRLTTLTKVEYDRDIWRVSYTLHPSVEVDPYSQKVYKDRALAEICGSDMRRILQEQITIEFYYTYTAPSGEEKLRISIPPGSCT